ncbi:MAG TPA: S8 family serine peptidase, partial [bacterium]|nr:S8 family serine peptidase [bacterium]
MHCGVRSIRRLAPVFCLLPLLTALPAQGSLPQGPASVGQPGDSHPSGPQIRSAGRRTEIAAPKRVPTEIRLSSGLVFDTRNGEPSVAAHLRATEAVAPEEMLSLLVQVQSPVQEGWRDDLEATGARIETFVPNSAFLVRVAARDRAELDALPFVDWTGNYHPAYRISAQSEMTLRSGRGEYAVLLFDDADVAGVTDHVSFLGGTVRGTSSNGINKIVLLEMDRGRVEDLAKHPDVQWLEPRARFEFHNANVQWVDMTGVNGDRKIWDEGITGLGQVVMVGDSGIRTSHNQFRDDAVPITNYGEYPTHRKIIAYKKGAKDNSILFGDDGGASYHGTHTDGTIAGNDDIHAGSSNDGIAKDAKIWFEDVGGNTSSIYSPGDLNDYFAGSYAGNAGGAARISSNSWGAPNGGAYDINCMTTDQFAWNHKDYLICFSNGNSGATNTVGSPAGAKSILSSGGTQNGTSSNQIYSSTSRGPTDDGRYKPTVCSPGQSVFSALGSGDTNYWSLSGTSMSCPNLAGSATLARQYFTDGWYPTGAAVPGNAFTPSASLLKAMMVNSGVDNFASYSIPDNNIGWGRILLDNVMYFPGDTRRTVVLDESDGVVTGEVRTYEVYVASDLEDVKVTLVWTDPASTPVAATNLVNDLDLVVNDGSNTYLGNVWSGGQSVTGGSADDLNVEENVRRASPLAGTWTIEVHGANVPMGAQPFALV